jgi:hypothetical protein
MRTDAGSCGDRPRACGAPAGPDAAGAAVAVLASVPAYRPTRRCRLVCAALLVLYSCFTRALLVLYSCFTLALLMLYSLAFQRIGGHGAVRFVCAARLLCRVPLHALLMLYSCFTHAFLMLYSCFTRALLVILRRYVAPFCCAACPYGLAMLVDSQVHRARFTCFTTSTNVRFTTSTKVRDAGRFAGAGFTCFTTSAKVRFAT